MKISRSVDRDFFNTTCKNAAQRLSLYNGVKRS
jgi:hypothetical protein